MIKKYLEQLGKQTEVIGTCYLDENYKSKLSKDLKFICLSSLYPNVIVQLYDNGILNNSEIEKIRWFLNHKKDLKLLEKTGSSEYYNWKVFVNSFFGKLPKKESSYITEYLDLFYKDLISEFSEQIVYIDCDILFIRDNPYIIDYIKKLDVSYDIIDVPFFWAEAKKRLVYMLSDGEIESKGFSYKRDSLQEKKKIIESIILTESRNDKLNKIGI